MKILIYTLKFTLEMLDCITKASISFRKYKIVVPLFGAANKGTTMFY